jgi:hypothetical protein
MQELGGGSLQPRLHPDARAWWRLSPDAKAPS